MLLLILEGEEGQMIEAVRARCLHYCAEKDSNVVQDPTSPQESGGRKVKMDFFVPADMCLHFGMEGGGIPPSA